MSRSEIAIHPLTVADIAAAERIRARIGWNQTSADWQRLLALDPTGAFVARVEDHIVGTVTTTRYGTELGWIGMLLVDPDHQQQGIGTRLLRHAIDVLHAAGVRSVGLDATPAGKILYDKWGFVPVWDLARWQVSGSVPIESGIVDFAIGERIWPELVQLDRSAFGAERPTLLWALSQQSSQCAILVKDDQLRTFGMLRAGSNAAMLGPLVAVDPESAVHLLAALWSRAQPHRLFWDIPEPNRAAVEIAQSLGFVRQRPLTRMVLGHPYPVHDPALLYAVADLSTG